VRERKGFEQARVGAEVEARHQHTPVVELGVALDLPARRGREQAVHRQPALVALQRQAAQLEVDLPASDLEGAPLQPVGPGVQEGDAHRRARLDVMAQPAALAEQLLATVPQRAADHPRLGHEGRLDTAERLARQRQPHHPVLGSLADQAGIFPHLRCLRA
jgi:hypothetical protein